MRKKIIYVSIFFITSLFSTTIYDDEIEEIYKQKLNLQKVVLQRISYKELDNALNKANTYFFNEFVTNTIPKDDERGPIWEKSNKPLDNFVAEFLYRIRLLGVDILKRKKFDGCYDQVTMIPWIKSLSIFMQLAIKKELFEIVNSNFKFKNKSNLEPLLNKLSFQLNRWLVQTCECSFNCVLINYLRQNLQIIVNEILSSPHTISEFDKKLYFFYNHFCDIHIVTEINDKLYDKKIDFWMEALRPEFIFSMPLEYMCALYDFLKEPYFFQDYIVISVQDEQHYYKQYELRIEATESEWRSLQRKIRLLTDFGDNYPIVQEEFFNSRQEFVTDRFVKFFNHIKSLAN